MQTKLPSLITSDAQTGMTLACQLAKEMQTRLEKARGSVERPGGMNFLTPPAVPAEIVSGILFYAIAAANGGWDDTASFMPAPERR